MLNRLHAWWEGMDADGDVAANAPAPALSKADGHDDGDFAATRGAGWPGPRLAAAQRLFGEGCLFPGAEQIIAHQIEPLTIEKSMSILDIAAGIGTATRVLARRTGATVDGLEADPTQVEQAYRISEKAGLGKQAIVIEGALGHCDIAPGTQDIIFGREALLGVADKETMFQDIWSLLKPGGEILLLDYITKDEAAAKKDAREWAKFEKMAPRLATVPQITRGLAANFLELQLSEDISEVFSSQILHGLATAARNLKEDAVPEDQRPWIMWEAELWARRAAMLQAGNIGFYCFHASKTKDDPA